MAKWNHSLRYDCNKQTQIALSAEGYNYKNPLFWNK